MRIVSVGIFSQQKCSHIMKKTLPTESDPSNKSDSKAELFGLNSIHWGNINNILLSFSANIKLLYFEKKFLMSSWHNYIH